MYLVLFLKDERTFVIEFERLSIGRDGIEFGTIDKTFSMAFDKIKSAYVGDGAFVASLLNSVLASRLNDEAKNG